MGNDIPPGLGDVARFQVGVVSRQQALRSGMSRSAITSKVKCGRWRQIYPGVYATFSGAVGRDAQLWAAVLYAGKGAQLSHETAAEVNGLTERQSRLINVSIPADRRVSPPNGVKVHLSAYLDLKARFPRGVVPLRTTLNAHRKLRWRGQLDEMIIAAAGGAYSLLEFRYDRDVERAHGLPRASHQVPFTKPDGSRGFRDRYYEKFGLVVELDGRQAHPAERRGEDRSRDNDATAGGGSTLRYDWDDVTRHGCGTAAQVARSLASRGWTGQHKQCTPACRATRPNPKAA